MCLCVGTERKREYTHVLEMKKENSYTFNLPKCRLWFNTFIIYTGLVEIYVIYFYFLTICNYPSENIKQDIFIEFMKYTSLKDKVPRVRRLTATFCDLFSDKLARSKHVTSNEIKV